jgi:hypothetical protein
MIDFLVREGAVRTPIGDSIANAMSFRLRMDKFVDSGNILNEIASDPSNKLTEIVLVKEPSIQSIRGAIRGWSVLDPHRDILVHRRVLAIRLKSSDFAILKLSDKTWIRTPEEADIWDTKEYHSETLESKSKGPASMFLRINVTRPKHVGLDNATAQDFQPVTLPENLQFERVASKGKLCINPADRHRLGIRVRRGCIPITAFLRRVSWTTKQVLR